MHLLIAAAPPPPLPHLKRRYSTGTINDDLLMCSGDRTLAPLFCPHRGVFASLSAPLPGNVPSKTKNADAHWLA